MLDFLTQLAQSKEIPILAAFSLGLLTAISPCPLLTNITSISYISQNLKDQSGVLKSGWLYMLGRVFSYSVLGLLIYFGASKFHLARFLQGKGEFILAPILIIVGLVMIGVIPLNFIKGTEITSRASAYFKKKGLLGSFALGVVFALAFCPYSGALYFGILIPLMINTDGLYLPVVFAFGTGIPVILVAYLITLGASKLSKFYSYMQKTEKTMRYISGGLFILSGVYLLFIYIR